VAAVKVAGTEISAMLGLKMDRPTMINRLRSLLSRSDPTPTPPVPFGYKTGWIAVPSTDPKAVADVLPFRQRTPATWQDGIEAAFKGGSVFITPPIKGWILVVGDWAMGTGEPDSIDEVAKRVAELSARFEEAQGFATHRVVEYHHWMLAKRGQLLRCFAYLGERGEVLRDFGVVTDQEEELPLADKPTDEWAPDENDVMAVAARWSIDPTKLSSESGPAENGILARLK
jgi:hypothetical protein